MAFAFVKRATGQPGDNTTTTSATFASAPTSGNLLVLSMAADKSQTVTAPSGWTVLHNRPSASVTLFHAWKVSDGSETTVAVTHTTSASGNSLEVAEYSDTNPGDWTMLGTAVSVTAEAVVTSWGTGTTPAVTRPALGVLLFTIDSEDSWATSRSLSAGWTLGHLSGTVASGDAGLLTAYDLDIPNGATASATLTFSPGDQASGAVATFARVAAQVTSSRGTTWDVDARVTSSRAASWATRARVTSARSTTWNVASALIQVTSSRSTTWNLEGRVTSSRSAIWTTRTRVTGSRVIRFSTLISVGSSRSTQWSIFESPTGATTVPMMRLRVYAPNSADLGVLPTPQGVSASYVMNDTGALSFTYAPTAPKASLLGQPCEVAVEVSPDSGKTWSEPPNSRFLYLSDGRDPINRTDRYSVDAKSWVWRFEKAKVLPNGLLNAEGKRAFNAVTPGTLLKTLFNEAGARGALAGVTHATFSTTTDSSGAAWAKTLTIAYEPGLSYLAILQNLADQGFIDFRTQGRQIQVYNADAAMALDRTIGTTQVVFRAGRDLRDAPFRRTWEGLANYAYFAGDGVSYDFTNTEGLAPWGRWETFISNGSVKDTGTMAALTQAELALSNRERTEYTRGLDFSRAVSKPHWDYGVGDYVWSAADGEAPQRLRVRQLTLTNSEQNILAGNVVLNDRFLEADIRQRRRIEGITNGASGGTGTGGPPDAPQADTTTPSAPTAVQGTSVAFLGPGGYAQSQVSLSWSEPTTNTDGTPLDDFDHYEVFERVNGSAAGSQKHVATTTDAALDRSPYVPGATMLFSVKAVDTSGHRSAFSTEVQVAMAVDTTAPSVPSTPVATASLGVVRVYWNGQPSTGSWLKDFDHVEVHASTTNSFTTSDSTVVDNLFAEGVAVLTGYAYGTPVYVKLVAVDKAGLKSAASAQATATPARLVGSDVDPGAISFEQIAFKDPGNVIPDGSFESPYYRSVVDGRSSSVWTMTTADAFHGTYSATANAATNPSTYRGLVLMSTAEAQQIVPGDALFTRYAYKGTTGANGSFYLAISWLSPTGTVLSNVTTQAPTRDGTWRTAAAKHTAPAGTASFRIYAEVGNTATTGTWHIDAIEVRRVVATEIIEDAAIGNAQIANLAVNNAKIADLEVGKLTAGSLTAEVLMAGRFRTATSGNRLEFDSTGIRMYRGTELTASWATSTGQLRVYNPSDATHTSNTHGLQFGDSSGINLLIDDNEIMARNNGGYSQLLLNREGGLVLIGGRMGGLDPAGTRSYPQDGNHSISLRGQVLISNTDDAHFATEFPPLMIGRMGDLHLYFDSNEIGAALGDVPSTLHLNAVGATGTGSGGTGHHTEAVYAGSGALGLRRHGSYTGGERGGLIFAVDSAVNVGIRLFASEVRAVQGNTNSGLVNMVALDFIVNSERKSKREIEDFDPIPVIKAAPGKRWKYRPEIESGEGVHFGPMLDDLPEMVRRTLGRNRERRDQLGEPRQADPATDADEPIVGLGMASLVGILWEANRLLIERVEKIEGKMPKAPEPT